jgi:hypothetical protein
VALAPLPARADVFDRALGYLDHHLGSIAADLYSVVKPSSAKPAAPAPQAVQTDSIIAVTMPEQKVRPRERSFSARDAELSELALPALPSLAVAELPPPSVEKGRKRLSCVEFTRALSGLNLFGDAKYWWARAKNIYARLASPAEEAVMVFTATKRLTKGHVAVVSHVISKREIRVEQANWQNHGEIDHQTPIIDVSKNNDWSQVRVWDIGSKSYGRVYAVSGFILKNPTALIARE